MKKFTLLLFLSFFILLHGQAQKEENVWVFGVAAGLDFNSGSAVSISTRNSQSSDSSIRPALNSGSVCDANGQLLFYTDGDWVWNRDHFIMPNGKDLLHPNGTRVGYNTTLDGLQSGTIVPVPGSDNLYYIFSMERNLVGPLLNPVSEGSHLFYSVVDMDLDGGLGDVVAGQKRICLDTPVLFTQKIAAVAGNNCDVWLITIVYDLFGAAEFRAYNITSGGINPTPVVSPLGVLSTTTFGVLAYIEWTSGKLVFSPDGSKMVHVTGHTGFANPIPLWGALEMYDFDPVTGMLSNSFDMAPGAPVTISGIPPRSVTPVRVSNGVAFSLDGSRLYALSHADSIYQWNLNLPTSADIVASKTGVAKVGDGGSDLKTGPDGKIYFGYNLGGAGLVADTLHRIESPDLLGTACNVVFKAVPLQPDTRMVLGFPNAVAVVKPGDTTSTVLDTLICTNIQGTPLLELKVTPLRRGVEWDDGSTDTVRVIHNAGTYWVRKYDNCFPEVDTFIIHGGYIPAVNILVNNNKLTVNNTYDSYQWYRDGQPISGATGSGYTVDTNGVYSVKVSQINGCSDSTAYAVTNVSVRKDQLAALISISPNPVNMHMEIRSGIPLHDATLRLINFTGQVVTEQPGFNGTVFRYDMGTYPTGIYIVEILENGETITRTKLVKQ